ncbi:BCCT family transporter [Parashewanella spongiae]|uniref:BCCT family transporter n=1 Tax=Parashewanella spongiae TaxID=342950 RepID=A0A3A6TPH5_9GAMM|nr:choline BCCT transporter BetT [Parashewanella spongiae]MCL1078480.1 choline BCCT transporter BetT [Parashewanella spongiae]RJY14663.1 BCCT family transporter [Parashewanella spongiae]
MAKNQLSRFCSSINRPVFFGSTLSILILICYVSFFPLHASEYFAYLQNEIILNASWYYVAVVAVILFCVAFLGLSRYGDVKLGPDHSEPEYSFAAWFSMLFSAGMGIGLMFFGVGEPVMHFLSPPTGEPGTIQAAKESLKITFFHWGLHAWAIYAIVALILAFFGYRHGLPLTLRSALYPIIGDRIYGIVGHVVDVFAILGTVFGVATALGYGVLQVNSGLNYLFNIEVSTTVQIGLIVGITCLATLSLVSGLDKGIKILSQANLGLAILLVIFVVVLGPTSTLLQLFVQNTGSYLSDIIDKTFNLYAYKPTDWMGGWTLFYWAWWLSWSPFVGMFIARISKGRTIREFVCGVLFVPTLLTFIWMTVFGNSAIDMIMNQGAVDLGTVVQQDVSLALFKFLEHFPFSSLLSFIAIIMVVLFFVTSSDSSAMVIDMLSSGGNSNTPTWQRIFWSSLIGTVALILMLVGGLKALQTATIMTALPFSIILLVSMYGLFKALGIDATKKDSLAQTTLTPKVGKQLIQWQDRLANLVSFSGKSDVRQFIVEVATPAMRAVVDELEKQGVQSEVKLDGKGSPSLRVLHGDERDFTYTIISRSNLQPSFANDEGDESSLKYSRAEVFLNEGGQDYDIMGYTKVQVIGDIIDQYEKHMHFLHLLR